MKSIKRKLHHKRQHYAPWDREAFLQRLETFTVSWWPAGYTGFDSICGPEWAKRGWICIARGTVECVLCLSQIVIRLPSDNDEEVSSSEKVANIYSGLIVDGHSSTCLWRVHGCEKSIYRLVFSNESQARSEFESRVESFSGQDGLVDLTNCDLTEQDIKVVDQIATTMNQEKSIVILALTGWYYTSTTRLIVCDMCFRRLVKSDDPLSDHMSYCPWINPTTQGRNEPGWISLAKLVVTLPSSSSPRQDEDENDDDDKRQTSTLERLKAAFQHERKRIKRF